MNEALIRELNTTLHASCGGQTASSSHLDSEECGIASPGDNNNESVPIEPSPLTSQSACTSGPQTKPKRPAPQPPVEEVVPPAQPPADNGAQPNVTEEVVKTVCAQPRATMRPKLTHPEETADYIISTNDSRLVKEALGVTPQIVVSSSVDQTLRWRATKIDGEVVLRSEPVPVIRSDAGYFSNSGYYAEDETRPAKTWVIGPAAPVRLIAWVDHEMLAHMRRYIMKVGLTQSSYHKLVAQGELFLKNFRTDLTDPHYVNRILDSTACVAMVPTQNEVVNITKLSSGLVFNAINTVSDFRRLGLVPRKVWCGLFNGSPYKLPSAT